MGVGNTTPPPPGARAAVNHAPRPNNPDIQVVALAPFQRLELSQDFRGGPVRCSAKGIAVLGPFGCGATRCALEMGRNTLGQPFFVCTPPEAWHGRRRGPEVERGLIRVILRGRVVLGSIGWIVAGIVALRCSGLGRCGTPTVLLQYFPSKDRLLN